MFLHRGKTQNLPAEYFRFHLNYFATDGPWIDGEKITSPTWKRENITKDIQASPA